MFASRTITAHLMRGLIAAALIAWAVLQQVAHPALALTAAVLAVVAMRGCPLCWTLGLLERARRSTQRRASNIAECGLRSEDCAGCECGPRATD